MSREYASFFSAAFGKEVRPFAFQEKLACLATNQAEGRLPDCRIMVPTGMGKTASVVLAWLWNQLKAEEPSQGWPRRLVYCLPMRSLVEQTQQEVARWLESLSNAQDEGTLGLGTHAAQRLFALAARGPIVLMGGVEVAPKARDWDLYPEEPAITSERRTCCFPVRSTGAMR